MTRPCVYAAHPVTSYGTSHEAACLARLGELFPGAEVFNPAGRYSSDAAWLRAWPRVLGRLSGLVVFADSLGTIGVGCMRELADALCAEVPVAALDPPAGLVELVGVELVEAKSRSPRRAALLVLGRGIQPSEVLDAKVPTWQA